MALPRSFVRPVPMKLARKHITQKQMQPLAQKKQVVRETEELAEMRRVAGELGIYEGHSQRWWV